MGKIRFILALGIGLFLLQSSLWADQSPYEKNFQKAIEQETAENWSAAIQYYLDAMKVDPSQPFPRQQIIRIFQQKLRAGKSIDALRTILPKKLEDEFQMAGVFQLQAVKDKGISPLWNYLIWGFVFLALTGIVGGLFWLIRKKEKKEQEIAENRTSFRRPIAPIQKEKAAKPLFPLQPKKESVITEKTREEIDQMISTVTSVTSEMKRPDYQAMNEEEMEALKDTDLIRSLAQTLVSDVVSEDDPAGKYSKMTVDGSLIFDEEDVNFFERVFGATTDEIEQAKFVPKSFPERESKVLDSNDKKSSS